MALHRPLIRADGRNRQLPTGDALAGLPVYMPAYRQDGTLSKLALGVNYGLAALTTAGASLTVQVVLNG